MTRGLAIFFGILALLALTVEGVVRSRDRSRRQRMERVAEQALLGGGLPGLLRARTMALGSSAAAGGAEAAATLALSSAMLASEYGLDEGNTALAADDAVEASPDASPRAQALKLASRALVEVTSGHADLAESLVRRSVALEHKQASPLFALGRVRFRQGNLAAAAHAFQAALVREPAFVEARVAWAEVWLEQGERARAKEALLAALQRTPEHSRAQLLLAELEPALASPTWEAACTRDESTSPFIASACALARAHRAWGRHDWNAAVELATAAGHHRPVDPRVLGGAVQLLACAGAVDRATSALDQAGTAAGTPLPALRWARIAVDLGRGQLVDLPQDLPAGSSPWAPLLAARIALASGKVDALSAPALELAKAEPVLTYVKGMQARLADKPALAAELLAGALAEHGDACRAAGEYLAACEAVGRVPDASAFAWLLDNNARCVNLPAAFAAADQKPGRKPTPRATRRPR